MRVWIGITCALLAAPAAADKAKPAPAARGFWKVMTRPNAKWVLRSTAETSKATITVETYDVRKVAGADVARLRWTYRSDGTDEGWDMGGSTEKPSQVAVSAKGLFILRGDADDAAITKALAGKPARSDPPRAYKGTKQNKGRYLTVEDGVVCMGAGPTPDQGDCPDVCDGMVCWDADGVTEVSGQLAPGMGIFER